MSKDRSRHMSEGRRFNQVISRLPPGSLVLGDMPALAVISAWTSDWRGERAKPDNSCFPYRAPLNMRLA
jgi:hypothetical protein